jgi:hypothetical protein
MRQAADVVSGVVLGAFAGAAFGAVSNIINSFISPGFFRQLGLTGTYYGPLTYFELDQSPVLPIAVAHGVAEGGLLGALVIAGIYALTSTARIVPRHSEILRVIPAALVTVLLCGAAGGAVGIVFALLHPDILMMAPLDEISESTPVGFGWVRGFMMGSYVGAAAALAVAIRSLRLEAA